MTRLVVSLLVAAVLAPATAQASDWMPVFEHAAVAYWGGGQLPPCGQPRYAWGQTEVFARPDGTTVTANAEAFADERCGVLFSKQWWPNASADPRVLCVTMTHEIGHLYGLADDEPGSLVMAQGQDALKIWRRVPPCAETIVMRRVCHVSRHGTDTSSECHLAARRR